MKLTVFENFLKFYTKIDFSAKIYFLLLQTIVIQNLLIQSFLFIFFFTFIARYYGRWFMLSTYLYYRVISGINARFANICLCLV